MIPTDVLPAGIMAVGDQKSFPFLSTSVRRCLAAVALVASLVACAGGTTPPPVAPPSVIPTRLTATGHAQRVVLVSFDGLSADELQEYGAPAFFGMAAHATRVTPVTPTVTSTTHTAILTGAPPEKSGIVSNQFHLPGTPTGRVAMGMETEIDAETLIDAARRAGKRVGCLTFPTVDATTPRRSADWGLVWHKAATQARIIRLKKPDFRPDWLPPTWKPQPPAHRSFSPVLRARIEWSIPQRTREDVVIAAYDSTDDNVRNYDTFYVEQRGTETKIDAKGWFAISTRQHDGLWGSWSKLLSFDPSLNTVTIYLGSINRNEGYPASFVKMIDDAAGFWPGVPDEGSARQWLIDRNGIDADTFIDQSNRLSSFLTTATTISIKEMPFDLLLAYQPIIDQSEHQFRITLDTQANATAENRGAAARVRAAAYSAFDRAVGQLEAAIYPAGDALVVTGDHGLASVDTEVRVNQLLVDWGFATRGNDSLTANTHWAAYATGNVVHLYRNGGTDDTDALVQRLVSLKAPDGAAVFERVERKTAASHRNSGDVVAFSYPRFALSPMLGELFTKPSYFGQHGGLNTHHEFQTALGATGAGVFAETVAEIRQTQIARYVCDLLGIAPPKQADTAP